ncbi:hypothetical protein Pan3_58 [Pseudanabaena phage Pan3]|nr:hypothetical protein Pan3_58 [Pseudanabaena phage Pan3]
MTAFVMTGASADEVWPLVRDFHYSRRNAGLIQHAFAWREPGGLFGETGEPLAAVTYSQPVNRNFPTDALELSRLVRRDDFDGRLSELVAWSLRWLRGNVRCPFVLSYADTTQGHHGGIYQACGFVYVGPTSKRMVGFQAPDGSFVHGRICNSRFGTQSVAAIATIKPDWVPVYGEPKHLYIFPLRQKWPSIARKHGWEAKPYPKPNAARQWDTPAPTGSSEVQSLGAAPDSAAA